MLFINTLSYITGIHMGLTSKAVFVISAKRTPFCKYGGSFRELAASHAYAAAAKDAIRFANVDASNVDCTIIGSINFLSQCDGGKTPRYCGLYSGVPIDKPALGVNMACGTGLQAIVTSAVDITLGTSRLCLTGGTEIMSTLPLLVRNVRFGTFLGKAYQLEDYIKKQIFDSYCGLTRPKIVENLAGKNNINRHTADEFALESYTKWKTAKESNIFNAEITNVTVTLKQKEVLVKDDEVSLPNIDAEKLGQTPPLIDDGVVVTAANSAAPADGAAAILLASEDMVKDKGLQPLARILGWAAIGLPPEETGLGATQAIKKILRDLKKNINDIDLFEINENFAPEVLIAMKELQLEPNKVNVSGGALSMGDPVSAGGARLATHLVHQLKHRNLRTGIAASSCGGGQGIAIMFERT